MLSVFVACPYVPPPLEGYRDVFRHLEQEMPTVKFVFADEHIDSDVILQRIDELISVADLTICDITGWNSNVALELGLALGKKRKVQIIFRERKKPLFSFGSQKHDEVPVDIRGHGRINYTDKASLREMLKKRLEQEFKTVGPELAARAYAIQCASVHALVMREPGLKIFEIASRLGMETGQLVGPLKELIDDGKLEKRGKTVATAYYPKGYVVPVQEPTQPPAESSSNSLTAARD